MSQADDEAEHSLEMHLPYIYKMIHDATRTGPMPNPTNPDSILEDIPPSFPKLVPILVGATSPSAEKKFGHILAPYLADPGNFFVISSDFCHWGSRFRYTYYHDPITGPPISQLRSVPNGGFPIHDSIARVDNQCMEAAETGRHDEWNRVLEDTGNTVCGRHPIGVMMAAIEEWRTMGWGRADKGVFRFVRYERSQLVSRVADSSVSYCSAYAVF
jgi:MEMO1 family protein